MPLWLRFVMAAALLAARFGLMRRILQALLPGSVHRAGCTHPPPALRGEAAALTSANPFYHKHFPMICLARLTILVACPSALRYNSGVYLPHNTALIPGGTM